MNRRLLVAVFTLVVSATVAACGGVKPLVTLPTDPATPATDGASAWAQASAACSTASTMSTEVRLSGRIGGRRARGRLLVGVASPASAYIDAPAPFGASAFIFAAVGDSATLLLPRDRRVLENGRPSEVLEAVAGVALTPADLKQTLSGCANGVDASVAQQVGGNWRLLGSEPRAYLRRAAATAPWQIVAVSHREPGRPEWRAEYAGFVDGMPRTIRLVSADRNRFDLQLALSQVELNVALGADVFTPAVPRDYQPITLEQLRDAGPLAEPER